MANKYLDYNGLDYFWDKIDNKKQDKLTAGSNITISGSTISASQPTVNNGTLTIQKNGTNVQTFKANQSGNATANITVPTKTSDITNDSGFITSSSLGSYLPLSGGVLTGNVGINELDNGGTYFHVKDSSKGTALSFGVGSGHVNHGIWSTTLNKWMIYGDNTNVYLNGNAATATSAGKLTTARTIGISGGATGTATSFNGTSNISIPVTDVKDAYVTWGGKGLAGTVSPDDMGCIDEFGHNKLAFLPATCINVAYSVDGGTTWTDYGVSNANKVKMVTTTGSAVISGGTTAATSDNVTNHKLRIRIACGTTDGSGKIYTAAKKILFNATDPGSNAKVHMRYRSIANYKAGTETWTDVSTDYDIRGGSGWNSIPFNYTFGGNMSTQTSQIGEFEFVFYNTQLGTWGNKKVSVSDIRLIGNTNWTTPSELARAGHLYSMDENQNATFPANVKVAGSLQHGSYTYTLPNKNGTVAMTSDIPSVPTVNNGQLTIQKNGSNVATFTANQSGNSTANIVVPTKTSDITNDSNFPVDANYVHTDNNYTTTEKNKLSGIASGAEVNVQSDWNVTDSSSDAFIKNKPTIPTVNNATLTIQKNGSTVKTFTANASSNVTANITVPTKTSDITNDSGYLTSIPKASASTLGGIKVGNNLTISSDGTLSANASAITVDSALSSTSTNPVQNKVINTALNGKQASLSTAQLNAVNSGITAAKVTAYDGYASQIATKADLSALDDKQDALTAGDHIDITNDMISATGYVHSENPVTTTSSTATVTGSMIANGTITADKLATGATLELTLSTTDIGEGAALAANTLYGVYNG